MSCSSRAEHEIFQRSLSFWVPSTLSKSTWYPYIARLPSPQTPIVGPGCCHRVALTPERLESLRKLGSSLQQPLATVTGIKCRSECRGSTALGWLPLNRIPPCPSWALRNEKLSKYEPLVSVCPEPWEDPKNGSTSRLYNPHHRSIGVQNWGIHLLDPPKALGGSLIRTQGHTILAHSTKESSVRDSKMHLLH